MTKRQIRVKISIFFSNPLKVHVAYLPQIPENNFVFLENLKKVIRKRRNVSLSGFDLSITFVLWINWMFVSWHLIFTHSYTERTEIRWAENLHVFIHHTDTFRTQNTASSKLLCGICTWTMPRDINIFLLSQATTGTLVNKNVQLAYL